MSDNVTASDGVPARLQGRHAEQKLGFIDQYLPPALSATRRKPDRVFLDMFAGPGLNRTEHGYEFEGSPLRAMQARARQGQPIALTRYIGCNIDETEHAALTTRVQHLQARGACAAEDVSLYLGDSNAQLRHILATVPEFAWICAFIDIEKPSDLPWSSLMELRRRHRSVDLYLLFPLDMGWSRLARTSEEIWTRAFGCEEWRPVLDRWKTNAVGRRARWELLQLYLRRLQSLWEHVRVVKAVRLRGDQLLYRMIFATNHPAGANISEWVTSQSDDDQLNLFGF